MGSVFRSQRARLDAAEIWLYVAEDSVAAADRLTDSFDEKLKMLAEAPGLGTKRDELLPGLRSFPVGSYLLFYREVSGGIEVARIVHGARDLRRLFRSRG
jgi:toxin ParE1/3/4